MKNYLKERILVKKRFLSLYVGILLITGCFTTILVEQNASMETNQINELSNDQNNNYNAKTKLLNTVAQQQQSITLKGTIFEIAPLPYGICATGFFGKYLTGEISNSPDIINNPDLECQAEGFSGGIAKFQCGSTTPEETGSCQGFDIDVVWYGCYRVDWTSNLPVCGIIEKAGNNPRVVHPGGYSGTITKTYQQDISHITFCCCPNGCLTITKNWIYPDGYNASQIPSTINISVENTSLGYSEIWEITSPDWQKETCGLTPGTYTITELDVPEGWMTTYPEGATIEVVQGQTAEIIVNNAVESGCLKITKEVILGGTSGISETFEICITGPSYPTGNCQTIGEAGGILSWNNLIPGTYTITETDPGAEWIVGGDTSVEVTAGPSCATATVTNTYNPGCLEVTKIVDWNGIENPYEVSFEISITGPSYPTGHVQYYTGSESYDFTNLIAGMYWVNETNPGSEWSVTNATNYVEVLPTTSSTPCTKAEIINTYQDQNHPPYAPYNPVPQDGSDDIDVAIELLWDAFDPDEEDTLSFDIYFDQDNPNPTTQLASDWSYQNFSLPVLDYNAQYYWRVVARDNHGLSNSSEIWTFRTIGVSNNPPEPEVPQGPIFLEVDEVGTYITSAIDPDGDMVQCRFSWDDGTYSEWMDYVQSGVEKEYSHSWGQEGTYKVRAQARDSKLAKSGWSEYLLVRVGENTNIPPTVEITHPNDGAVVYDIITIEGTAEDTDGTIQAVTVIINGIEYPAEGTETWENWMLEFDTSIIEDNTYQITAISLDDQGAVSEPDSITVHVDNTNGGGGRNHPPDDPIITGPSRGKYNVKYTFNFSSRDIDFHDVMFVVNWSDGEVYRTEFVKSEEMLLLNKTWVKESRSILGSLCCEKEFLICAKAIDEFGLESNWSNMSVTVPRTYSTPILTILYDFFDWLNEKIPIPWLMDLTSYSKYT